MIQSIFTGEKIYSNSQDAFSLNQKSSFGEKKDNKIEYSLVESIFLAKEKRMMVLSKGKFLTENDLIRKLRKLDKKIETKLSVFEDLRKKGYVVKTALKYGADFRVYTKGAKPGNEHARWLCFSTKESDILSWQDFTAKNRIAHSTKKNLLIAIVDEESDVSYYEISWIKP